MTVTLLADTGVTVLALADSTIRNAKPKDKLTGGVFLYLLITPKIKMVAVG